MTNQYEIFTVEADGDTKDTAINTLLGYPDPSIKTDRYRILIKHYTQNLWAGVVNDQLTNACSSMTPAQRAVYYNDSDLKTYQYLVDNSWFKNY